MGLILDLYQESEKRKESKTHLNFDRAKVERAKKLYPPGTRVELVSLCNEERDMPVGLRGTVVGIDDQPALLMHWDNGRSLSLLVGEDDFKVIHDQEETESESPGMGMSL